MGFKHAKTATDVLKVDTVKTKIKANRSRFVLHRENLLRDAIPK